MRKFLTRWNQKKRDRIISTLLALCMIAGLVGNYPIVSQAAETVTSADFYASDNFTVADNPEGGVQVTHNAGIVQYSCLTTSTTYDVTQGVHFDVEGITAPYDDGYSFIVHMGFANVTALNYAQSTVTLAISSNGNYKVWRTSNGHQESDPAPSETDIMIGYGTLENPPTGNKLSFDIKVLEAGKYELAIEGNETITLTEPGASWFQTSDFKTAKFGFQIWPSIVDTATYSTRVWEKPASAGATYVIKDISNITLDRSQVTLATGKTATLKATKTPADADETLIWESTNPEVATVENGVVTAVAKGNTTIVVKSESGKVSARCEVKVIESTLSVSNFYASDDFTVADNPEGGVQVTHNAGIVQYSCLTTSTTYDVTQGVHFDVEGITAPYGDGYSFIVHMGFANVTALNYAQSTVTLAISSNGNYKVWRTSNDHQESDPAPSETDIMIGYGTLENPPTGNKLSFDIKVLEAGKYELAIEGNETITLTEPGTSWFQTSDFKTAKFGFQIWPSIVDTATYSTRVWNISASAGATYVIKDISKIVVEVQEVSINTSNLNLLVDGTAQLSATVSPANADNVALTWASDNEGVATVDENGMVTAVATGTAWITVSTANGKKAYCQVHVAEAKYPANVPYVGASTLGVNTSDKKNIYDADGNCKGVNVTYLGSNCGAAYDPWAMFFNRQGTGGYDLTQGFRIEINDIQKVALSDNNNGYSIAIGLGVNFNFNDSNTDGLGNINFDAEKYGYVLLCKENGEYAIIPLRGLMGNGNVVAQGNLGKSLSEIETLALEVKAVTTGSASEGNSSVDWEYKCIADDTTCTATIRAQHAEDGVGQMYGTDMFSSDLNTQIYFTTHAGFYVGVYSDFTVTSENKLSGLSFYDYSHGGNTRTNDVSFTISKLYNGYNPVSLTVGETTYGQNTFTVSGGDRLPVGYQDNGQYISGWKHNGESVTEYVANTEAAEYEPQYVDTDMLDMFYQKHTTKENVYRLGASVDIPANYKEAGFILSRTNDSPALDAPDCTNYAVEKYYTGILAGDATTWVNDIYGTKAPSKRFFVQAFRVKNPTGNLYVRAYVKLSDDTVIYGTAKDLLNVNENAQQ